MPTAPTVSPPLAAGRWTVDTNYSSIGLSIRHLGASRVGRSFTAVDDEGVIGEALDTSIVSATVDGRSIASSPFVETKV
jgi:polyisoprenoid-binding protein YceI